MKQYKNNYERNKARVQQQAIEWQLTASEKNYSQEELVHFQDYFYKQGKQYGLLQEFKENGII